MSTSSVKAVAEPSTNAEEMTAIENVKPSEAPPNEVMPKMVDIEAADVMKSVTQVDVEPILELKKRIFVTLKPMTESTNQSKPRKRRSVLKRKRVQDR